jgi:hypothetical protein
MLRGRSGSTPAGQLGSVKNNDANLIEPEMKSTTAGPALTGGPVVGEGAHRADAIGVELAAEWLMLGADRGRLRSTRIKGLV